MSSAKDTLLLAKLKAKTEKGIRDVESPSLTANTTGELPVAKTVDMKPLPVATTTPMGASDILKAAKMKDLPVPSATTGPIGGAVPSAKTGQIGGNVPTATRPYSPVSEFLKKRK